MKQEQTDAMKRAWKASIFATSKFESDLRRKNLVRDIFYEGYAAALEADGWVEITSEDDLPKEGNYLWRHRSVEWYTFGHFSQEGRAVRKKQSIDWVDLYSHWKKVAPPFQPTPEAGKAVDENGPNKCANCGHHDTSHNVDPNWFCGDNCDCKQFVPPKFNRRTGDAG
jgi:ribosomal protein L32